MKGEEMEIGRNGIERRNNVRERDREVRKEYVGQRRGG